jgi:hypothetical protein
MLSIARSRLMNAASADALANRPIPGDQSMIRRKTAVAAGLICAALGLHGLAHASPPSCVAQCGKHLPESLSDGVLVHPPSLSARSGFHFANLRAPGSASRVGVQAHRSPGLTWTLLQSPPRAWTERQPIALLVALGPSNPRYGELLGGRPLVDTAAPSIAAPTAAGWTRPLGLRLAIRW